ncbi:MAG: hypothetical protein J6333_08565 [Planctomycetes bacterium]|nr:hypothetical protein [Planctomycetota bacterium]
MDSPLLDSINSPADLRGLSLGQLQRLAQEIRARMIEVVGVNGGHLASNLGVVELTIALHRVFDFSKDFLVLDVGHQCYPHKLLTGRRERFPTLRQHGGLSGFPNFQESPYDLSPPAIPPPAFPPPRGWWRRRACGEKPAKRWRSSATGRWRAGCASRR